MRKNLQKAAFMIIIMTCAINFNALSQFTMQNNVGNYYGTLDFTLIPPPKAIGIGNFPNTTNPASALHVNTNTTMGTLYYKAGEVFRTDCPNTVNAFWRLLNGGTENGNIFTLTQDGTPINNNNFSLTATVQDITFHTLPYVYTSPDNVGTERMRIVGVTRSDAFGTYNAGNVGIGTANPVSMLHIGASTWDIAGYRSWMDVGTFYGSTTGYNQMYVGMKYLGVSDHNKEVINWGDNVSNDPSGDGDRLCFIYTAPYLSDMSTGASKDGLEVARMLSDENYGFTGFGDFTGTGVDPMRRVEILGNGETDANGKDVPQLRLTYTQATPPDTTTTGVWTDFQTTSAGNLLVMPKNGSTAERVGIGATSSNSCTTYPITTLHVGNSGTNGSGEITSDGLLVTNTTGLGFNVVYNNSCGTLKSLLGATDATYVLHGDGTWGPAGNGLGLGYCDALAPLANNGGWDLSDNNLFVAGQNVDDTKDRVGIGYDCSFILPLPGKLSVEEKAGAVTNSVAGYFHNGDNATASEIGQSVLVDGTNDETELAIGQLVSVPANCEKEIGIWTRGGTNASENSTGVLIWNEGTGGYATGEYIDMRGTVGDDATGIDMSIISSISSGNATGMNISVQPSAQVNYPNGLIYGDNIYARNVAGATANVFGTMSKAISGGGKFPGGGRAYGVLGDGEGGAGPGGNNIERGWNIGVEGLTNGGASFNVGIYGIDQFCSTCAVNAAGLFNGDLMGTSGFYTSSDSILKDSVQALTNAMSIINQLNPKSFVFKTAAYPTLNLPRNGRHNGLIAQQVETVLPNLVDSVFIPAPLDSAGNVDITYPTVGFKALNYTELIPVLIGGEKELKSSIDSLRSGDYAWSTTGNAGTNSGVNFIGTTDNASLSIATNDTSRMFIDSLGRVGIGTTTPTATLTDSGTFKLTDGTQAAGNVLTSDANGLASWQPATNAAWGLTGNTGTNSGTNFIGTTDNASLSIATNDTSRMFIDSLGRVGIGTTTPTATLTDSGTFKLTDGTQAAGNVLTSDANGLASWQPATNAAWGLAGNAGTNSGTNFIGTTDNASLNFATNDTSRMIIDSLGNVQVNGGTITVSSVDAPGNPTGENVNITGTTGGSVITGINVNAVPSSFSGDIYGVIANSIAAGSSGNIFGMYGVGGYGDNAYGAYGWAGGGNTGNIGVYAYTNGGGSGANYGLYAIDGGTSGGAAGFFQGDVGVVGTLTIVSDQKLKTNVAPLQNAMSVINELSPKTYNFDTMAYPYLKLDDGSQAGLIAQDVQNILPGLVKHFQVPEGLDSTGHPDTKKPAVDLMTLNYIGLVPYLIQGMKEQQQTIDSLSAANQNTQSSLDSMRNTLSQIQSQINGCCGTGMRKADGSGNNDNGGNNANPANGGNAIPVDLANAIILNQNDPNPFRERTSISYNISDEVQNAQIVFFDNLGRILKTVVINERGAGMLDVFAGNLSSGIYSYSLIADGNVIDTKKMVCNK